MIVRGDKSAHIQAMPLSAHQNVFAGNPLDRAADRREDPAWLEAQLEASSARALVLWEGQALTAEGESGPGLAWLPADLAGDAAADRWAFLGLDGATPVFAIELEVEADPTAGPLRGLGRFMPLRQAAGLLPGPEAAMAGCAKSLFDWRRRHGFCAACGRPSRNACGGWKRVCEACRTEHFPRVDPVVIMLAIHTGEDGVERCMMGRGAGWPEGRMSALAGFLEPGESIEEACARELFEEAGLRATAVRYHSSQPWPFPSSLMIGLYARVADDQARPDQTELEEVRWFAREEARALLASPEGFDGVIAPNRYAIARSLLETWAGGQD